MAGALGWGVGDFLGGIAARRLAVLTVLVVSQVVGLLGVYAWVLLAGDAVPSFGDLAAAGGGGIAALVGLVAPISAASPVVPLAVDAGRGITPSAAQWLGVVLVVAGIVSLSWEPSKAGT